MSWSAFAAILLMNLVGAAAPGPDVVLITRYATRSRRHAIAAATGIQVGVLFWSSLTVFGAAALLTAFPGVLSLIQVVGGCFLVFMGVLSIRSGLELRKHPPQDEDDAAARLGSVGKVFRTGLATNLSNPKIVLFFGRAGGSTATTAPTPVALDSAGVEHVIVELPAVRLPLHGDFDARNSPAPSRRGSVD